jgi:hypothetical protein
VHIRLDLGCQSLLKTALGKGDPWMPFPRVTLLRSDSLGMLKYYGAGPLGAFFPGRSSMR